MSENINVDNTDSSINNQFNNPVLNNPVFNNGNKKIRKLLGTIPIKPEIFIGRHDVLEEIHEKLFNNERKCLLLVNGEGGIGKTTVASCYYHKYIESSSLSVSIVNFLNHQVALFQLFHSKTP